MHARLLSLTCRQIKKKKFSQLKNSSVIDITETAGGALSID
jgi:hypothetical protein